MADSGDRVEDHVEAVDEQYAEKPSQQSKQDQDREKYPKRQKAPGGDPIHNDEAHLDPSRWWFASSAFPMIAGTLGPVASAFSICALVRPWRQKFPPGSDIDLAEFIADPIWCVAPLTAKHVSRIVMRQRILIPLQAYSYQRYPAGRGRGRKPGSALEYGQEDPLLRCTARDHSSLVRALPSAHLFAFFFFWSSLRLTITS